MPRPLSSYAILEKNKLTANTVWPLMLEITIPGGGVFRITSNNESISWRDETWIAMDFKLGPIGEESKGEVPQLTLSVSNVSRVMEAYLQAYDTWRKTNGFSPIELTIYVVVNQAYASKGVVTDSGSWGAVTDSGEAGALTNELYNITNPDPEAQFQFELKTAEMSSTWATFTLGAANPFNKRFPMHRILKNHCRFIFKSSLCGYDGATSTCNKTLTFCRSLTDSSYHDPPRSTGNSARFGGFPGTGQGGLRLA